MLTMIVASAPKDEHISRVDKPMFSELTARLMMDLILEDCFQKPVEQIDSAQIEGLEEIFDPMLDDAAGVASWQDPSTDTTYTFVVYGGA